MNNDVKSEPKELAAIEADRQVTLTRFSPDGKYLFAGSYDAIIRRWDLSEETPRPMPHIEGHHGWVQVIAPHPTEEVLFSADSWGGLRATRYSGERPEPVWTHEQAHDGWIRSLALGNGGKLLATCGRDRRACLWNALDGKLIWELPEHGDDLFTVAIHPDGKSLMTADLHGVLRRWDIATGKNLGEVTIEGMYHHDNIQEVAGLRVLRFTEDGQSLLCAGGVPQRTGRSIAIPTIRWVEWPSLKVQHSVSLGEQSQGFVFDLTWHPNGYWVVATSGQPGKGQFLLLKPGEDQPFFGTTKMYNCHSVDVHRDGRIVVASTNRSSQGNGAVTDKEGNYLGNTSPIHLFLPPA